MKVKLQANAELDMLTKNEVSDALNSALKNHLQNGIRIRPIVGVVTDPNTTNQITLTCQDGNMWDIRSIYALKSAADTVRLFLNNVNTARLRSIPDDGDNGSGQTFTRGDLVLRGGQSLIVNTKLTGTTLLSVVLWVMEVPDGHDWHLK